MVEIQRFCQYLLNYSRQMVNFRSKYGVWGYYVSNDDIVNDVRFKMVDWQQFFSQEIQHFLPITPKLL